eukprot:TRINITY_DN64869_c0_g1_i1.p1 TRINITY_DN64869_c0_g1~~TRINITY_DN64869_c0_g1_i1.p1  ORF type:complete len:683 (+),score=154.82 TRINITY_DN64869_c0_g1_i1:57-2105(+)
MATSLKEELRVKVPRICELDDLREARRLFRVELGGTAALRAELVFAGFVDPDSGLLSTEDKPFNIFAHITQGLVKQPGMEAEQEALGHFKEKFVICRNKPENDACWESEDPKLTKQASMSKRHRFLTTKSLHWQWFNALVFGIVDPKDGGCDLVAALREVEEMKAAALHYAKHAGGWSSEVGLFVNVFGHNNVNSLFVHILDMSACGPSFKAQAYKNCPLDVVLQILRAEQAASQAPAVGVLSKSSPGAGGPKVISNDRLRKRRPTLCQGIGGATSLKEELVARIPVLRDSAGFREARRILTEELGGLDSLSEELLRVGFVDADTYQLTTGPKPFNLFARIASGAMEQPGMAAEQEALAQFQDRFCVCCNLPQNDEHWNSKEPEWLGKASMSKRHRFLTTRNLHWKWFNALTFGMPSMGQDAEEALGEAIAVLEDLRAAALAYAANIGGWSQNLGLFFHVFGHNSVHSLHLHLLDMDFLGPTYSKLEYKNCPLDAVLKVLQEERAALVASRKIEMLMEATALPETATSSSQEVQDEPPPVAEHLQLNVGGEQFAVSQQLVESLPAHSRLRAMLREAASSRPPSVQSGFFLDLPPLAFRRLVDQLRLLLLAGPGQQLPELPPYPAHEEEELRALADLLGLGELLPKRKTSASFGSWATSSAQILPVLFYVAVAVLELTRRRRR